MADATTPTTSATTTGTGPRERVRRDFMLGEGGSTGGGTEPMHLGLGPQHPAMHGIIRINTELDGEVIVKADVEIGYLHRAFEKECEVGPYNAAMPYTDRLNYVSPLINNFGFASCVEKLLGIQPTERCQAIRRANRELAALLSSQSADVLAEKASLEARLRAEAVLASREYAYCLFPEKTLRDFLLEFI